MKVESVQVRDGEQLCTVFIDDPKDVLPDAGSTLRRASDGLRLVVRDVDGPVATIKDGKPIGAIMGVVLGAEPSVAEGDELQVV